MIIIKDLNFKFN